MGIIVFLHHRRPVAITCVMPETLLAQLTPKATHIGQAEILAAMMLPLYCPDEIRDQAIIHFVDNQSAIAGLVKCYSTKEDSSSLLGLYAVLMTALQATSWIEFVESEANASDGISRDGIFDLLVTKLNCEVSEKVFPEIHNLHQAPLEALISVFSNTP